MTGILPHYTHVVNKRLKHTYLGFDEEGGLVIKSPPVSQTYIESLLLEKSAWINKSRKRLLAKKGRIDTIREGGYFYLLGTVCPLSFRQETRTRALLESEFNTFTFVYTHFDSAICRKKIEARYRVEIERCIPSLIDRWSQKMQLYPAALRYRKTKRQWGSCSTKNVLSFNTMLMKTPLKAIEYVVVHELAHIKHKHHQKAFWQLVETHLPDYKERQHLLHEYTPT